MLKKIRNDLRNEFYNLGNYLAGSGIGWSIYSKINNVSRTALEEFAGHVAKGYIGTKAFYYLADWIINPIFKKYSDMEFDEQGKQFFAVGGSIYAAWVFEEIQRINPNGGILSGNFDLKDIAFDLIGVAVFLIEKNRDYLEPKLQYWTESLKEKITK